MPVMNEIHGVTKDNVQVVLDGIRHLIYKARFDESYGVCYNLNKYLHDNNEFELSGYDLVHALAHDYEGAFRNEDGSLADYFIRNVDGYGLWNGPNLVNRRALLMSLLSKVLRIHNLLDGYVYTYGDMVQAFKAVLDGKRDDMTGICSNFAKALSAVAPGSEYAIGEAEAIMRDTFMKWPKFSGDTFYPVPHPEHGAIYAYDTTFYLWEVGTEYGENRFELAQFCVDELSKVDPDKPALAL